MAQPPFPYDLPFDQIDFRERPDLYRIGRGEQGVLMVEPYKSEILPHWRFKTPEIATDSAAAITKIFHKYREAGDFVGMDMARKFLQMGFTRSRRYANHASGRKWSPDKTTVLPDDVDPVKAQSASIFYAAYVAAKDHPDYLRMKAAHLAAFPDPVDLADVPLAQNESHESSRPSDH